MAGGELHAACIGILILSRLKTHHSYPCCTDVLQLSTRASAEWIPSLIVGVFLRPFKGLEIDLLKELRETGCVHRNNTDSNYEPEAANMYFGGFERLISLSETR